MPQSAETNACWKSLCGPFLWHRWWTRFSLNIGNDSFQMTFPKFLHTQYHHSLLLPTTQLLLRCHLLVSSQQPACDSLIFAQLCQCTRNKSMFHISLWPISLQMVNCPIPNVTVSRDECMFQIFFWPIFLQVFVHSHWDQFDSNLPYVFSAFYLFVTDFLACGQLPNAPCPFTLRPVWFQFYLLSLLLST